MPEFKFNCPLCEQHIQCDSDWAGEQIACPGCQGAIVIPAAAPAAPQAVPTVVRPRLTLTPATHTAPTPPPPPAAHPRPIAVPTFTASAPAQNTSRIAGILKAVAVFAVLGVAVVLAWPWLSSLQSGINESREKARDGDGGQVGHIAELYSVLDATDPARIAPAGYAPPPMSTAPAEQTKVIPPVWTLDVASSAIPEGKANGQIAGSNFVVQSASISKVSADYVLALRSGALSADRELLVYLRLKPGQPLQGEKWVVASDAKSGVPQIAKRWQPGPGVALQQKFFRNGYALKLEFGQPEGRSLPGKIYAALPDPEQTVVAGNFTANLRLAAPGREMDTFADD